MKLTITEIKRDNKNAGYFFFERATMRFFNSIVYAPTYGTSEGERTYFVTSEQFQPSQGPPDARKYTVRYADGSGDIGTFNEFQEYCTLADARDAARRAVAMDIAKRKLAAHRGIVA